MSVLLRRGARLLAVAFTILPRLTAYVVDGGPYWTESSITLELKLGSSPTYSDGTNPNSTASEGVRAWNSFMVRLQVADAVGSTGQGSYSNSRNEVFFSDDIFGYAFGTGVLAVAVTRETATQRLEGDVIVNRAEAWDSYRGALKSNVTDLRRVITHEVGHILGLSHPDEFGQSVPALMNAYISDLDAPTPDDRDGVSLLYGNGPGNPARLPELAYPAEPYDVTVTAGYSASFEITVRGGSPPIFYQWRKDGVDLPGATGQQFSLPETTLADAGLYAVRIWNAAGSLTSREARLTVRPPTLPSLGPDNPSDTTVTVGQRVVLSVDVQGGTPPVTYQWRKNGQNLTNQTYNSLGFDGVNLSDAATYSVVVSNRAGSTTSREATLTVLPATGPTALLRCDNPIADFGDGASFICTVSGSPPFTYIWRKDGFPRATSETTQSNSSSLWLTQLTAADGGEYSVEVSNAGGTVITAPLSLIVLPMKPLSSFSLTQVPHTGDSFDLTTYFYPDARTGAVTYQWYRDGEAIAGATTNTYTFAPATTPAGDYALVTTSPMGPATSEFYHYQPPRAPPAESWLAAERSGDIAYFLFASPARIERFDLAGDHWLPPISLPRTPTALRPDPTGLYVAVGKSVSRFALDGSGERVFATAAFEVRGLYRLGEELILFGTSSSNFVSVRLSDGQTLGSNDSFIGISKPGSLSVASGAGCLFGRTSGVSPAGLYRLTVNADGSLGQQVESPYHGDYPDADRTFVSPDERLLYEDSGMVFDCPSMQFVGAIGSSYDDLGFRDDGRTVILRRGQLIGFSDDLKEIGRSTVDSAATRFFVFGPNAVLFAAPVVAGGPISKTRQSLYQFVARASVAAISADSLSYTPDTVSLGSDGVVYLHSRLYRNVFRWSVADRRYLSSLPLLGSADSVVYSEATQALYARYLDNSLTQIHPAQAATETPFATAPIDRGLTITAAGDHVVAALNSGGMVTGLYGYANTGAFVERFDFRYALSGPFEWSPANHRLYCAASAHGSDFRLYSIDVLSDGRFGAIGQSDNHLVDYTRLRAPIRIAPDGHTIVLGSGLILDGATLRETAALPNPVDDAVWLGARLYTARNTFSGVQIERWVNSTQSPDLAGTVPGRLLRLFALPEDRLLLVLMRDNAPSFVLLDASLGGAAPVLPRILAHPVDVVGDAGSTLSLSATATGAALSYQWQKDGVDLPGATAPRLSLSNLTTADVGSYALIVRNAVGTVTSSAASVSLSHLPFVGSYFGSFGAGTGDFALIVQSNGATAFLARLTATGQAIVATGIRVEKDGSFAWTSPPSATPTPAIDAVRFFTGAISGRFSGNTLSLQIPSLQLSTTATRAEVSWAVERAGLYQGLPNADSANELFVALGQDGKALVVETAADRILAGATVVASDGSLRATLDDGRPSTISCWGWLTGTGFLGSGTSVFGNGVSFNPPSPLHGHQRLANISSRGIAGKDDKTLIAGFVVTGSDPKDVLIRAVGPTLTSFGVSDALANPTLTVHHGSTAILSNDDWSSTANDVAATSARLGAFALASGSRDAALVARLSPGLYSAQVGLSGGAAGVAMIEVYDAGTTDLNAPKVVNISTRAQVGCGDDILIAGFVITGDAPKKILVRGVGPTLAAQGVGDALSDPQITVYTGSQIVAGNDDWEENNLGPLVAAAAAKVGAFALPAGSKDSSLLLYLQPGVYTVHVRGVNNATGVSLVEVYEVTD